MSQACPVARSRIQAAGARMASAATGSALSTARVTTEVRHGAIFVPYFVQQLRCQLIQENVNGSSLIPVRLEKE